MLNTLFARLSLALLAIVTVTGGALFVLELFSTRNYHEEITQRLNASIAMYVTGESQLIEDGAVNAAALETLAQRAMIINPTVEVYLLDTEGQIVGHGVPDDAIRTRQVEMRPVQQLISGNARMPLRGTDPLSDREKVFSAHPVMQGDQVQGYLYAILGGRKYDELASSIRGSYIQTFSLGAVLAILAAAFLVGLLVFGLLTRRLARLTAEVKRFTESGFDATLAAPLGEAPARPGDEIGELRTAFGRMSAKILQQFEDLKETDRLRRELISNVSHDLRTPLSSMHGYVETLLIKNDSLNAEERRHYLEITRKHSQRLGRLISDLFELSKLEAASIEPQFERFSLAELLQDVTQEFALEAEHKNITLRVEGDPERSIVRADIGLVQRVLENLLRNAIKYTPGGGSITVRVDPRPDSVAVSVADTGCGIAEKDLERVFDRFYRSEQDEGPTDSAGLGLAIVQKILELHGSRISVSSELNAGTTFEFDLPGARAA
jgi:signal transduction histidine kinase